MHPKGEVTFEVLSNSSNTKSQFGLSIPIGPNTENHRPPHPMGMKGGFVPPRTIVKCVSLYTYT